MGPKIGAPQGTFDLGGSTDDYDEAHVYRTKGPCPISESRGEEGCGRSAGLVASEFRRGDAMTTPSFGPRLGK